MPKKETTKKKSAKTPVKMKDLPATKNPKGGSGGDRPTESITFNYGKLT